MSGTEPLVIGIDAGGTSSRASVATTTGRIIARARAAGANANSVAHDPATALTSALTQAMAGIDPTRVVGGVFGIAGAGGEGRERAVLSARTAWNAAGLSGTPGVVTDIVVAFAAGCDSPSGIVLIAGTGAVAAAISGTRVIRRADGYGWLLGDEGSGVWIGTQALRAVLAGVDGRGEQSTLGDTVPARLLGANAVPAAPGARAQAIVRLVYDAPPATTAGRLGSLAPLVTAAAAAGDPVARRIAARAARHLLQAIDAVTPAFPGNVPVVLTGSVLGNGPIAETVKAGLIERFGRAPFVANDGTVGAIRLAIQRAASATPVRLGSESSVA